MKALKRKLILSFLERRKKKEPFDLEASETFSLPGEADININNSHFFTASSLDGSNLSIRLGMRNGADWEIFVLYRDNKRFLVHERDNWTSGSCPVSFVMLEAGKKWRIEYDGKLRDCATGEVLDSKITVVFSASLPIYDFMYHADRFNGMADAIAREKWNKDFFNEIGRNNQRHYEQTGRIEGYVQCGGELISMDMPCVRDHSFGRREWDLMNDHLWCLGITEKGEALCFSIVNYPRMKRIFSGYTNIGSVENLTLRDYEVTHYETDLGKGGDMLGFRCFFPDGKPVDVSIRRTDNVCCTFDGGKYVFQEGLGDFTIDGVRARGTIEYGFNGDRRRWEGFDKI